MNKKIIEQKSEELIRNFGYLGDELDVVQLAKFLGFQVGIAPLTDEEDGFIVVDEKMNDIEALVGIRTDKIIGVNSERNLQTKRFIIAHELGHYVLHYQESGSSGMYAHRENKKGKDAKENDVDFFAACLLMPKKYFKEKFEELKDKNLSENDIITLLEKTFNVPEESVKRRLCEVTEA